MKGARNILFWGILVVLTGHTFGLLAHEHFYIWLISNETKRLLAIVMSGLTVLTVLAGILLLCLRRFTNLRVCMDSRS